MNSSISVSERSWRRLLARYALCTVVLGAALAALLLVLDPYDTGRLTPLASYGVPNFGQRLAFASVGRRADVDAAIIGNSTIQLLDPARLSKLSGDRVVSLAIPGTGPLEQLAVADWFRRHHPGAAFKGLALGLDTSWCATARLELANPFPFWLYAPSALDYAVHLMRYQSFEAAWRKVKLMAGRGAPGRADGYHDYDSGHVWDGELLRQIPLATENAAVPAGQADFVAAPLLKGFLERLDATTRVVLLFVPRYGKTLPPPGSAAAARQDACKAAFQSLASSRPRTIVLDWLVDNALVRKDENFWDGVHYGATIARLLEDATAVALASTQR
jgi:hypothetical protein